MSDEPKFKLEQGPEGGLNLVDLSEQGVQDPPEEGAQSGGTNPGQATPDSPPSSPPDSPPATPPDFTKTDEYQALSRELEQYKTQAANLENKLQSQPKFDDYLNTIIDTYQKGGDLSPYLKAATLNPDNVSDDAAIMEELNMRHGGSMTPEEIGILFEYEKSQAGFKEDADEDALRVAQINWKAKATASRAKMKAELSKYRKPEFDKKQAISYYAKQLEDYYAEQASVLAEQQKEVVLKDEKTLGLIQNKGFVIKHRGGDGKETEINVAVANPYKLVDMAVDNNKFWQLFSTPTASGEQRTDLMKFFKVAMYAEDPEGYERMLINAAAGKAKEDILDTLENPDVGDAGSSASTTADDDRKAFAQALLEQHGKK